MRRLVLTACIAVACDRSHLSATAGTVEISPAALDFGDVQSGSPRWLAVALQNTSVSPKSAHLSSPAPFALERDVMVGGGSTSSVDVFFAPVQLGPARAALTVTVDGETTTLPLTGTVTPAVICAAPIDCHTCNGEVQPDGSACTSANLCIIDGTCHSGVCLGAAPSCDDGNPCTKDVCEPSSGCNHIDISQQCPAATDPCAVGLCDPATGCTIVPAADGTSCGPSDCVTANVCLAGQCKAMAVPEGYACGTASPCQSAGTCHLGQCAQAAPGELTEAWSYAPAQTVGHLLFEGVTDPQNNLYWLECSAVELGADVNVDQCSVVSYSATGAQRYATLLPIWFAIDPMRQLIVGDLFITVSPGGQITATRRATGAPAWNTVLMPDTLDTHISGAAVTEVAADASHLAVLMAVQGAALDAATLFMIDPSTGAVTNSEQITSFATGLVLDESGNGYYLTASSTPAGNALTSIALDATPRWSVPADEGSPLAALDGDVMLRAQALRSTLDGSSIASAIAPVCNLPNDQALMSGAARWLLQSLNYCACCEGPPTVPDVMLTSLTADSSMVRFMSSVGYGGVATDLVLLSDSSVLLASKEFADPGVMLRAIDAQGAERFACSIPNESSVPNSGDDVFTLAPHVAMMPGQWAVLQMDQCESCLVPVEPTLRVFATPGLSEAAIGWTGMHGGPSRAGKGH